MTRVERNEVWTENRYNEFRMMAVVTQRARGRARGSQSNSQRASGRKDPQRETQGDEQGGARRARASPSRRSQASQGRPGKHRSAIKLHVQQLLSCVSVCNLDMERLDMEARSAKLHLGRKLSAPGLPSLAGEVLDF